ncbi:UPF0729 protein AAEL015238 [Diaphorina citri]|jgi:hypothetical protein|uniref:UPF0729 protein AAEL015238 n=1 Tax=Diaphorina citri TaxID=121845 RepID=A0A1S3DKV4_DIACI|nr:UPF0729 protein AAEL015238 [Diaphorina citri]
MVCVPCFIIPALLFLWRLLQPYIRRFWNPIDQNKDKTPGENNTAVDKEAPEGLKLPFGITCPTCPIRGPCPKVEEKEPVKSASDNLKVEKVD